MSALERRRELSARSPRLRALAAAIAPKPSGMVTSMYRAFDGADHLLYLGIANAPRKRLVDHARWSDWAPHTERVAVEWFETRDAAEAAELAAITAERPLFNYAHADPWAASRLTALSVGVPIIEIAAAARENRSVTTQAARASTSSPAPSRTQWTWLLMSPE